MVDHSTDVTVAVASLEADATPSANVWWTADATSDRTLDWYQYLLELDEKHGDPEAYLNRLVAASSYSACGTFGYTPMPSEDFLDRAYRLLGDAHRWSEARGWDRIAGAFDSEQNPTMFERWKDASSKRNGFILNESLGQPAVNGLPSWVGSVSVGDSYVGERRIGGVLYRNRSRTISRVARWTYDEAEYIASSLSMLEAPGNAPSHEWRLFTENSMKNNSCNLDWEAFLSNPNLPLGETEPLFRELVESLYSAVAASDTDRRILQKLNWVLMNPNASGDNVLDDLDIIYYNASQSGMTIPEVARAIQWHPNWVGPVDLPPMKPTKEHTDEWVDRALFYAKKGDDIALAALTEKALVMLATPDCEEQVRRIIRFALETGDFALLYAFSPALPAVICGLERDLSGEVGNLPMAWVLEIAGMNTSEVQE